MSKGNTSALKSVDVENAKKAIDTYITTATQQFEALKSLIDTLTSAEFTGDAANGFKTFFTNKITPVLTTNLTDPGQSLTASLKTMLDNIKTNLLDTVDKQLGDQNASL